MIVKTFKNGKFYNEDCKKTISRLIDNSIE